MLYFETIKCNDFSIYNIEFHKQRISQTIGLNINLEEYIYPPTSELLKCKVIYDASGIVEITYTPYQKKKITTFQLVFNDSIEYQTKKVDRTNIEKLLLYKGDCDEIIIVKDGFVTDTSIANITIYYKNQWITPKVPLLYGTTRARYLQNQNIKEMNITPKMLKIATHIGLLNAMIDFDILSNFDIKG